MNSRYVFAQYSGEFMRTTLGETYKRSFMNDDQMNWVDRHGTRTGTSRIIYSHGKEITLYKGDWLILDTKTNNFYKHLHYLIDEK